MDRVGSKQIYGQQFVGQPFSNPFYKMSQVTQAGLTTNPDLTLPKL